MEDKIEIGEYVRIEGGYIRQVVGRDVDNHILLDIRFKGTNYLTQIEEKEDIVNHSKNIIKLIEVGDYVNGMLVTTIINMDENGNYTPHTIILCNRDKDCTLPPLKIYGKDIKSIVTHEQFESMKYEIKEG